MTGVRDSEEYLPASRISIELESRLRILSRKRKIVALADAFCLLIEEIIFYMFLIP
jgi:hypothetical protein